jgi:hypothetical protein
VCTTPKNQVIVFLVHTSNKETELSLVKRLDEAASKSRPGLACRLGSILRGSDMSAEEKTYLQKVLETPADDPARIPTTAITQALHQEGYQIGVAAVNRHRRRECRCYGMSPKFMED